MDHPGHRDDELPPPSDDIRKALQSTYIFNGMWINYVAGMVPNVGTRHYNDWANNAIGHEGFWTQVEFGIHGPYVAHWAEKSGETAGYICDISTAGSVSSPEEALTVAVAYWLTFPPEDRPAWGCQVPPVITLAEIERLTHSPDASIRQWMILVGSEYVEQAKDAPLVAKLRAPHRDPARH